jgi:hypothetical protein
LVSDGDKIVSFAIRNIDGPGSIGKDSIMTLTIKDNEASLAKTFAQGNFKVYPNPAHEFVVCSNAKNISKIEVLDMAGRLLANHSMNQTEDIYTMNVIGFSGFVFVRITDLNGQTFVERLVVK